MPRKTERQRRKTNPRTRERRPTNAKNAARTSSPLRMAEVTINRNRNLNPRANLSPMAGKKRAKSPGLRARVAEEEMEVEKVVEVGQSSKIQRSRR
jgi:hypothetical protein